MPFVRCKCLLRSFSGVIAGVRQGASDIVLRNLEVNKFRLSFFFLLFVQGITVYHICLARTPLYIPYNSLPKPMLNGDVTISHDPYAAKQETMNCCRLPGTVCSAWMPGSGETKKFDIIAKL